MDIQLLILKTLTKCVLDLSTRVGTQPKANSARGVTIEMVDDLRARFETLLADVALLKQVFALQP